LVAIRN